MALIRYLLLALALLLPTIGYAQVSSSTIPMWLDTSVSPAQWRRTGTQYPLPVTGSGGSVWAYGKASTALPSYTDGTYNPLSLDLSGELRTVVGAGTAIIGKVGIDQTTPGTTNGVQVNAPLPAGTNVIGGVTQSAGPWTQNVTQFGGNAVATGTGASGLGIPRVTVSNDSSVGINAGTNIIGKVGIDQTTPGTTNGVQVNAALPAGANTIGAVTQASGPWSENITQFGGSAVVTGTGASGVGIPRVTVSNDSSVTVNASSNIIGNVRVDQTTPGTTNGTTNVPTSNTTAAIAGTQSVAAASNAVLKASAGNLYSVTVTIGATSGWVMIFDATSLPVNGATGASLKYCYPVVSNGTTGGASFAWPIPLNFTTGITVGFSSTACSTLTASTTAYFAGQVK